MSQRFCGEDKIVAWCGYGCQDLVVDPDFVVLARLVHHE